MASSYPGGLDNFSTAHADSVHEPIHAADINNIADAANKIEAELGINPKGIFSSIKNRLDNLPLSGAAKYRLVSNGTTVTAYDSAGAVVASSTDGGAVLTACLPAADTAGATIEYRNDGNIFPQSTVPALPKGITRRLLIRGNGATVQLSSAGRRFLDFNKTADNDTFQNITIDGFVIDAANLGGKHHVVLGTYVNGVVTTNINIKNITLNDIKTINVLFDVNTSVNHRLNVWFSVNHAAGGGTQNVITDCNFINVRMEGGNFGIGVSGTGAAVADINIYIDRILMFGCWWSSMTTPDDYSATGGYQIGSRARGGTAVVWKCYAQGAGDNGFEMNGLDNFFLYHCVTENCGSGFVYINFATPEHPNAQKITYLGCASRYFAERSPTPWAVGRMFTFSISTPAIVLGAINIVDCVWNNATTQLGGYAVSLSKNGIGEYVYLGGYARELNVTRPKIIADGLNFNDGTAAIGHSFFQIAPGNGPGVMSVKIRDAEVYRAGALVSASSWLDTVFSYTSQAATTPAIDLDFDGLVFNDERTGILAQGTRLFDFGPSSTVTLKGRAARVKIRNIASDTAPRIYVFRALANLTIDGKFTIEDNDFSGAPVGVVEVLFVTGSENRNKVYFERNRWKVFPRPSAAMSTSNFAAATFTTAVGNQYIGGDPAEIHFATGTGAGITLIDVSKDGTTYENAYTQASGAMAQSVLVSVDNGDFVRVTFATTQPTTRVRFRR